MGHTMTTVRRTRSGRRGSRRGLTDGVRGMASQAQTRSTTSSDKRHSSGTATARRKKEAATRRGHSPTAIRQPVRPQKFVRHTQSENSLRQLQQTTTVVTVVHHECLSTQLLSFTGLDYISLRLLSITDLTKLFFRRTFTSPLSHVQLLSTAIKSTLVTSVRVHRHLISYSHMIIRHGRAAVRLRRTKNKLWLTGDVTQGQLTDQQSVDTWPRTKDQLLFTNTANRTTSQLTNGNWSEGGQSSTVTWRCYITTIDNAR